MMPPQETAQTWLACLQDNGYRLTASRQVVVEVIAASSRLLSPYDVFQQGRTRYPRLGLVTVYRTVEKLEELGLIQRVHQPSGCHAFVAANHGHQHLLVCQGCGRVEFFGGDSLDALMAAVGNESGYRIREHWLQLFGVCAECQTGADLTGLPNL